METHINQEQPATGLALWRVHGRLDTHGSARLTAQADQAMTDPGLRGILLDLRQVPYLSSAGLRVFLTLHKRCTERHGALVLYGVQPYCASVMEMAGFDRTLTVVDTEADALRHARTACATDPEATSPSEESRIEGGRFRWLSEQPVTGTIDVLGDINDVLHARITEAHIASKPFFQTEYSLGLGALGQRAEDYLPIMGESIMIGGTMVWLPTDGHDTPDFLIPRKRSAAVTLRTGFNVCVRGGFNETARFRADGPAGLTISALYRALFDLAAARRPDFRGAIGLAMRAEIGEAYGSGVTRSPIEAFKPADGEMILHPNHFADWFEIDRTPRHRHVTALICGAGVDLTRDLSGYDQTYLHRAFYLNPSNQPAHDVLLHNHAVFFSPQSMNEQVDRLEEAIRDVVDNGDFIDMRHLLDQTTISSALIGINYVQDFREDRQR